MQISVPPLYRSAPVSKCVDQAIDDVDRAVTTASAADPNSEVAPILGLKHRKPVREKTSQLLHHLLYILVFLQKVDDHWILSGEGPEFGLPVGIWKTAHVENIVGVDRRAMFKAERLEKQSEPAA